MVFLNYDSYECFCWVNFNLLVNQYCKNEVFCLSKIVDDFDIVFFTI